jgi:zinicin-like metallopeptidase
MRGPLAPPEVPIARSRAEQFDDLVLDAVERVERAVRDDPALAERVAAVALAVEDVPPPEATELASEVPLARSDPQVRDRSARLVLYRRPIELRTPDIQDRGLLVHEVVVDELADLLGVPVDRLDPEGSDDEDEDE